MKTTKEQTNYNKVVNIDEDGEITVLDYTFIHSADFKGAIGNIFYPVSKKRYDEKTETDNVIEYLIDSGLELPGHFERGGYAALVDAMEANDEIEDFMFDTSYRELWDELRKVCKLTEDEAYIFECVGGGRCFDKDFQGNVNKPLSKIIRKFES